MASLSDTPPVVVSDPIPSRYEYAMGYHRAVVERVENPGAPLLWYVSVVSSLTGQLEELYYDDETLAQDGAKTYVKGIYDAEMAVRQTFYNAYLTAYGRGSAPEEHGPNYVAPAPPPPA